MYRTTETTWWGLIAILRGLRDADASDVGECLHRAGFRSLEVPLNSPDPFRTIGTLRRVLPEDCMVGAGTVLTVHQVRQSHEAGAQFIVSPNTNTDVIAEALQLGQQSFPGAATPSEAFTAIDAGARHVKVFPASQVGTAGLSAWTAVIPRDIGLIPVGGVNASNIGNWLEAGAVGFGIGSALFSPAISLEDLRGRATSVVAALQSALESSRKPA